MGDAPLTNNSARLGENELSIRNNRRAAQRVYGLELFRRKKLRRALVLFNLVRDPELFLFFDQNKLDKRISK